MPKKISMTGWRARTRYDRDAGPPVSWRPGYALPRRWQSTIDASDLPYLVELDFTADDERGPTCRALRLVARGDDVEIGPGEVRSMPTGRCVQLAISAAVLREDRPWSWSPAPGPDMVEAFRLARPSDARTKDARLREVAKVYKAAEDTGKPTRAVQDALYMSYSTAARLVMEARRRGFLPPSERRSQRKRGKR